MQGNMKRLDEIEARLAAATSNGWYVEIGNSTMAQNLVIIDSRAAKDMDAQIIVPARKLQTAYFIANAPDDIRDLLAVVKLQRLGLMAIASLHRDRADQAEFWNELPVNRLGEELANDTKISREALEACDKILGDG